MAIRSRDSPWGITVPKIAPTAIAKRRNIVVLTEVKKNFISNKIETDSEEAVSENFGLLIKSELQIYLWISSEMHASTRQKPDEEHRKSHPEKPFFEQRPRWEA